MIKELLYYY